MIKVSFYHHLSFAFSFSPSPTGVHSAKTHRLIRVLYNTRKQYSKKLENLALPTQRSFEIPLTHGTRAAVQILYPPSWREELRDANFPVLVEV
jgi:inactive dipeptidyl peptidase 10